MTWLWLLVVPAAVVIDRLLDGRPWAWTTVRDTGVHLYQQHEDGRRRVRRRHGGGHQPVDRRWVETGVWSDADLAYGRIVGCGTPRRRLSTSALHPAGYRRPAPPVPELLPAPSPAPVERSD